MIENVQKPIFSAFIVKALLIGVVILCGIILRNVIGRFPAVLLAVICSLLLWNNREYNTAVNGWNLENIRKDAATQLRMQNGWMYLALLSVDVCRFGVTPGVIPGQHVIVFAALCGIGAIVLCIRYFYRLSYVKREEIVITDDQIISKRVKEFEESSDAYYITFFNGERQWESMTNQTIYEKVRIGDKTQSVWVPWNKRPLLVNYCSDSVSSQHQNATDS